ncbi:MAG: hypothetical protein ACR2OG_09435 [Gemmatimonadaceae bacterium]
MTRRLSLLVLALATAALSACTNPTAPKTSAPNTDDLGYVVGH